MPNVTGSTTKGSHHKVHDWDPQIFTRQTLREASIGPNPCSACTKRNNVPSPYKLISPLCFLTCYTLFISPSPKL